MWQSKRPVMRAIHPLCGRQCPWVRECECRIVGNSNFMIACIPIVVPNVGRQAHSARLRLARGRLFPGSAMLCYGNCRLRRCRAGSCCLHGEDPCLAETRRGQMPCQDRMAVLGPDGHARMRLSAASDAQKRTLQISKIPQNLPLEVGLSAGLRCPKLRRPGVLHPCMFQRGGRGIGQYGALRFGWPVMHGSVRHRPGHGVDSAAARWRSRLPFRQRKPARVALNHSCLEPSSGSLNWNNSMDSYLLVPACILGKPCGACEHVHAEFVCTV